MFDHISAIYHLLVDKLEQRDRKSLNKGASTPQRKASITTGIVDRSPECEHVNSPLVSMPTIPAVHLMNDNQALEKFGDIDVSVEQEEDTKRKTSSESNGDKYLTVRRHTVGPGDATHQQVNFTNENVKFNVRDYHPTDISGSRVALQSLHEVG